MSRDYGPWLDELERVHTALLDLADGEQTASARSTIATALDQLKFLENLLSELRELDDSLADIDQETNAELARHPEAASRIEANAAFAALISLHPFLFTRAPSQAIRRLSIGLQEFYNFGSSPLFRPRNRRGRKADPWEVVTVKAAIAGMTKLKQKEGMNRKAAAMWIATCIPPHLARRLSTRQEISPRTVEEWLDRFGGKHRPAHLRATFTVNSEDDRLPLTKSRFLTECDRFAERLITRA